MPTLEELKILQNLPLELKIAKTKLRIREWVNHFGSENCYISFSGGKDSTVLLDLVRSEYPDIEAVFIDTGLEYPEIKEFVKSFDNVVKLRPEKNFRQVILDEGYPILSKEIAQKINYKRKGSQWAAKYFTDQTKGSRYRISDKWHFLAEPDCPFNVSNKCCDVMKKKPVHQYERKYGKCGFVGTTTEESALRKSTWVKNGCNAFNAVSPKSSPLSFWREQDILKYIYDKKLPIAKVYGDVVFEDGKYRTTGVERTGCVFCGFGAHLEKKPNRYQRLYCSHKNLWDYCMKPIEIGGLGFQTVLDAINVPTKPEGVDNGETEEIQTI